MPKATVSQPPSHNKPSDTTVAVDRFMAELDHPFKAEIQAIRELVLAAAPDVREGIKWNAPSYRTSDYFATTNLRAKGGVGVILHLGARVRNATVAIDDPHQLLAWHGSDRASLVFTGMADIRTRSEAFKAILAQWLPHV